MTNVVPFPRAKVQIKSSRAAQEPPSGSISEVLLFLGVRYERHEEVPSQNATPDDGREGKAGQRRKRTRRRA
jgi:hypothetical protein